MIHAAQTQPHHQQDYQAQGQIESTWWKTGVWNELFQDLCACCYLVCNQALIVMGIIFNWALRQVDFVMAYPQAPIEMDIYMELH